MQDPMRVGHVAREGPWGKRRAMGEEFSHIFQFLPLTLQVVDWSRLSCSSRLSMSFGFASIL